MPRELTHIILAEKIAADLNKVENIKKNRIAYYIGVNAPDILFFSPKLKQKQFLHGDNIPDNDTSKIIVAMLDALKKEKNPELASKKRAFIHGYLCHMAGDTVFHPYIYSISGSSHNDNLSKGGRLNATIRHIMAETWLDIHFVKQNGYDFNNFKPFKEINRSSADKKVLSAFLGDCFESVFATGKPIAKIFRNNLTKHFHANNLSRQRRIRDFASKLDNMFGQKLSIIVSPFYHTDKKAPDELINFSSFKHPVTAEIINKNLDNLTSDAVTKGRELILAAEQYLLDGNLKKLNTVLKGEHFSTGMPKTSNKDLKYSNPMNIQKLKGEKIRKFMAKGKISVAPCGIQTISAQKMITTTLINKLTSAISNCLHRAVIYPLHRKYSR